MPTSPPVSLRGRGPLPLLVAVSVTVGPPVVVDGRAAPVTDSIPYSAYPLVRDHGVAPGTVSTRGGMMAG